MFINVIPQLEQCRSTSSVRMTFRRYRERIALWDQEILAAKNTTETSSCN